MRKLSSILFAVLLMLTIGTMVQTASAETNQLIVRKTLKFVKPLTSTVTVPLSGHLSAGQVDSYGPWDGGVTEIVVQIYWTPTNKNMKVNFWDETHLVCYNTDPEYSGGYANINFFVPSGHTNCKWSISIWGKLSGQETIDYHGYAYIIRA